MKFTNGLFLDSSNTNQPSGTWKHLMNGTFDRDLGVITDEDGFRKFGKNLPNYSCIGTIAIDNNIIAFFTNSVTTHEIGIINENGYYDRIILATSFNFDEKYPIKCKLIKNYKGERLIIFIDDHNIPRIINIDDIPYTLGSSREYVLTELNKFNLFPDYTEAKITTCSIGKGGSLLSGTYYVITQYENTSTNIKTAWSKQSCPFYISADGTEDIFGSESGLTSSRKLKFTVSSIDTRFDILNLGIVYEINGVTYAKQHSNFSITSTSKTCNISSNSGIDLTLDEILVNSTNYIRVGDIEVTDSELLGANVIEEEDLNFQRYANLIEINYVATYETIKAIRNNCTEPQEIGNDKGFRSGEVYAFYASLVLKKGGESRLFHITGRPPIAGETSTSSLTASEDLPSGTKVFQVENTTDAVGALTNMGYWENEDEVYPSTDDFDSSSITNPSTASAGIDLQGVNVRHHRFPDQRSLQAGSGSPTRFGVNQFCKLGIVASNIIIPTHIADKIVGVKIYYAKRDTENMTCLGQSLFQFEHVSGGSGIGSADGDFLINGIGNFRDAATLPQGMRPAEGAISFNDFALTKNLPKINPIYIVNLIKLIKTDIFNVGISSSLSGERVSKSGTRIDVYLNYTLKAGESGIGTYIDTESYAVADADYLRKVNSYDYIPHNTILPLYNNLGGESHLSIRYNVTSPKLTIWTNSSGLSSNGIESTDPSPDTFIEQVYLTDLKQILNNVYYLITLDRDVICTSNNSTGSYLTVSSSGTKTTGTLYNGDTFLDFYTSKRHSITATLTVPTYDPDDPSASDGAGAFGIKIFLHESIQNTRFRYEDLELNNTFYPKSSNAFQTVYKDVSLFYSSDFNQLNDNNALVVYNPNNEVVNNHPFRIIRSNAFNRDGKLDINFPPLQYYEISKKREEITGINYYNDKLTIRCKNGTFITRPKQKIITDAGDATLGSNDLFDIEPRELLSTDNGYIKSKSKFDTILIEHGLILLDSVEGKLFLLTDQVMELTSRESGIQNYFNDIFYNDINSELVITFGSANLVQTYDASNRIKVSLSITTYGISSLDFKVGDYLWLAVEQTFCKILKVYSSIDYSIPTSYVTLETDFVDASPVNQIVSYYRSHSSIYYDSGVTFGWNKKENTLFLTIKQRDTLPLIYKDRYVGHYYNSANFTSNLNVGDVVKYGSSYRVWDGVAVGSAISLIDDDITLSFNFEIKKWISFHGYIPDLYCYIKDDILSLKDNLLYKHNQLNRKGQYYSDVRENFELSVVFNNGNAISKKYYGLNWIANFIDSSKVLQDTITFETIQCSNEYDDLTEIALVPFVNLASIGNTRNIKGTWSYNALKNTGNKLLTDKYLLVKFTDSQSYSLYLYEISTQFRLLDKSQNEN